MVFKYMDKVGGIGKKIGESKASKGKKLGKKQDLKHIGKKHIEPKKPAPVQPKESPFNRDKIEPSPDRPYMPYTVYGINPGGGGGGGGNVLMYGINPGGGGGGMQPMYGITPGGGGGGSVLMYGITPGGGGMQPMYGISVPINQNPDPGMICLYAFTPQG